MNPVTTVVSFSIFVFSVHLLWKLGKECVRSVGVELVRDCILLQSNAIQQYKPHIVVGKNPICLPIVSYC